MEGWKGGTEAETEIRQIPIDHWEDSRRDEERERESRIIELWSSNCRILIIGRGNQFNRIEKKGRKKERNGNRNEK